MKLSDVKKNHAKKNLLKEKNNRHNLGGPERCKDSITIKKAKEFVRVGEKLIELMVSCKKIA
jgi:hypothetical protein